MVAIGFPEKTVSLKLQKKVVELTPLRLNSVERKLEKLLNITIKDKTVFFRQIIAPEHGFDQF